MASSGSAKDLEAGVRGQCVGHHINFDFRDPESLNQSEKSEIPRRWSVTGDSLYAIGQKGTAGQCTADMVTKALNALLWRGLDRDLEDLRKRDATFERCLADV